MPANLAFRRRRPGMCGLTGRNAIVTGGGGAIGRAISLRLGDEGCTVIGQPPDVVPIEPHTVRHRPGRHRRSSRGADHRSGR